MTMQGDVNLALTIFIGVLAALLLYRMIDRWLIQRRRAKEDAAAGIRSQFTPPTLD